MSKIKEFIKDQYAMLDKSIYSIPDSRQELIDMFELSNLGNKAAMQIAINYGYLTAIENLEEFINNNKNEKINW